MFEGDGVMAGLILLGDSVIEGTVPIETTRNIKYVSTYTSFLMLITFVSQSLQLVHIPVYYYLYFYSVSRTQCSSSDSS